MRSLFIILPVLIATAHADEFADFRNQYRTLRTAAGSGEKDNDNDWSPKMEGKAATKADLSRPHMTMADAAGNLYIADKEAHAVRKVLTDGTIHTIAGTGKPGFSGDGKGTKCTLTFPNGLFAQPDGTLYIFDLGNDRIRRLDLQGNLTTILHDREGIIIGRGLWVSPKGDVIYYCSNSRIRSWTPKDGIRTIASGFASLGNIDVDRKGQLYATDRGSGCAYRIKTDGTAVLIAGNGDED
ncbi:MAG: sugar lactone lactonase YvrE, partial [Verrucomicrobiales bacterium]